MPSSRLFALLSASALLVVAVACIDLQRTNPFDPETPITYTIEPETLFSVGGAIRFSFVSQPPLVDTLANWLGGNADLEAPHITGGGGVFISNGAPLWPKTETVPMLVRVGRVDEKHDTFYRRAFPGSVVITQRLVRIQARCPDSHACDTISVGGTGSVFVDGFDALGSGISGLIYPSANPLTIAPIATFIVRDSTIAIVSPVGMRAAVATARKSGSTWVVVQRDSLRDSLRIVVR